MEELQECFGGDEPTVLEEGLSLGDEVVVGGGAFAGMHAFVLRLMPARRRIQILLDVLSGPTPVEVDCGSVTLEKAGAGA
jgi:transcription antitermination factor NusG